MIKWFASLIRRIVGRLKEYMTLALMTAGTIFIPLGVYMMVEGTLWPLWVGKCVLGVGFLALMTANVFAILDRRQEMKEKQLQTRQLENIRIDIVTSVNGLVNEIRQERNERNDRG
jgi:hypothetical protein